MCGFVMLGDGPHIGLGGMVETHIRNPNGR